MSAAKLQIQSDWIWNLAADKDYSKTCVKKGNSKIDKIKILMTNGSLMKVKSIA